MDTSSFPGHTIKRATPGSKLKAGAAGAGAAPAAAAAALAALAGAGAALAALAALAGAATEEATAAATSKAGGVNSEDAENAAAAAAATAATPGPLNAAKLGNIDLFQILISQINQISELLGKLRIGRFHSCFPFWVKLIFFGAQQAPCALSGFPAKKCLNNPEHLWYK